MQRFRGEIDENAILKVMPQMSLTWHQRKALRRNHELRNRSAHIKGPDFLMTGKMLCGRKDCPVTISPEHRHRESNKACKSCAAAEDKLVAKTKQ